IRNLYRFIDWVMILPRELETEFWQELKQFEQESRMSYMTTGERIGYERGKEEGQAKGQYEHAKALILKQLQKRLGELPQQVKAHIESLTLEQLDTLGEELLDFTSTADLRNWLESNPPDFGKS
ncbi:DUF4351 domain-containing protein, partial [Aetokthonos hydrillicola]